MASSINLAPASSDVAPGGELAIAVEVTHHGPGRGDFLLSVRGVESSWVTLRPPALALDAGAAMRATVLIRPPAGAPGARLTPTVRLVERSSGAVVAEASTAITVLGPISDHVDSQPPVTSTQTTTTTGDEEGSLSRWVMIGGGAAALVLLALLTVFAVGRFTGGDEPEEPTPFPVITLEPTEPVVVEVQTDEIASCAPQANRFVSLLTDDATTAILYGDPELTELRILRTEPAARLSGLFDPLVSLSGDGSRLAYVVANNPAMDGAEIWDIDVTNPQEASRAVSVPTGFWPLRPAWSPDNRFLAYVALNEATLAQDTKQLDLWFVELGGTPFRLGSIPSDLLDRHALDHSTPLCWSTGGETIIFGGSTWQVEFNIAANTQQVHERLTPPDDDPRPDRNPPKPAGAGCGVPIFSQNDPAWRHHVMQTWGDTIGDFGCALTSTAMILSYYGVDTNPAQLNQCLGPHAELIYWGEVPPCSGGLVNYHTRHDFSWDVLDRMLAENRPAIVGMVRGQTGMHFVVVTAGGGGNAANYAVTDPWDATTSKTLQTFVNSGFNMAWVVEYSGSSPGSCDRVVQGGQGAGIPSGVDGSIHKDPVNVGDMLDDDAEGTVIVVGDPEMPGEVVTPEPTPSSTPDVGPVDPPLTLPPWIKIYDRPLETFPITPGLVLEKEGVYFIVVKQPSASGAQLSRAKITIDRSPPEINVSAFGTMSPQSGHGRSSDVAATANALSQLVAEDSVPRFVESASIQLLAYDRLSGVIEIDFRVNDGEWERYSDDVSFKRTLIFDEVGEYLLEYRATDLAGNQSDVGSYRFEVVSEDDADATPTPDTHDETPTPTPTPSPTPTPTPTPHPTPSLVARPHELNFEPWHADANEPSPSKLVTIHNPSSVTVRIHDVRIDGIDLWDFNIVHSGTTCDPFSSNSGTYAVGPGQSCVVEVNFWPTGNRLGQLEAQLIIAHDASHDWLIVQLRGSTLDWDDPDPTPTPVIIGRSTLAILDWP
jgi:hypothetical protein